MKSLLIFLFSLFINLAVYIIKLIATIISVATIIILAIGLVIGMLLSLAYESAGFKKIDTGTIGDGLAEYIFDAICMVFEKRFWIWHRYTVHIKKV